MNFKAAILPAAKLDYAGHQELVLLSGTQRRINPTTHRYWETVGAALRTINLWFAARKNKQARRRQNLIHVAMLLLVSLIEGSELSQKRLKFHSIDITEPCLTPNHVEGEAKLFKDCPSLFELSKNKPISPENAQFIRESRLMIDNGKIYVCCPLPATTTTTTTTTTTPKPQTTTTEYPGN